MASKFAQRTASEYTWWRALIQYSIIYAILYPYFKIFYKVKVIGRENIPKDRAFIVASNHMSYLDPVIISFAVKRPIAFMAKEELFKVPGLAQIIDVLGAFAVNRKKLEIATIRTAKAVISTKKWVMAMYPQGTRIKPGKIGKINQGFAYLAKATKAEILPLSIIGSDKYCFIPFKGNLIVKIGKPFSVSDNLDETMDVWGKTISDMTGFEYNKEEISV